MVQSNNLIINRRLHIQEGIADRQIIIGIIIVFLAAFSSILSSRLHMGLLSIWPVFVLFLVFVKYYELGLICFVLSFAYQAPVVFAPGYGLSAVIRLDELFFAPIFLAWFLRASVKKDRISFKAPLRNPLLFYVLLAFLSLVVRYNTISSTPFIETATGLKGLGVLVFKLSEEIGRAHV